MGMASEEIDSTGEIQSTDDLIAWLTARDEHAEALTHPSVRLIINDEIAPRSTALKSGDTIAFCPPFSGG
jgi:molybdopterin converting factor small subunit